MKKQHLTPDGFEKYKAEWHQLKFVDRPEMQEQVRVAAAEGDRSENAAYTYGKMRLRHIDQRLRKLDRILDHSIVVKNVIQDGTIRFGARVELIDLKTSKMLSYQLVGSHEVAPLDGRISMESPMGAQLKGKSKDNIIEIQSPRGPKQFLIKKVRYT
tara:strand:+ start:1239 stop:1709 length:471 start_codon:yes stop_codon:yes gene_type:complete